MRQMRRTYQNLFADNIFRVDPSFHFYWLLTEPGHFKQRNLQKTRGGEEEDKANSPVPIVFANRSVVIRIVRQIANSGPVECSGRITQPTKCPGATRLYYRSRKGYTLLFRVYVTHTYTHTHTHTHREAHIPRNHFSLAFYLSLDSR